MIAATKPKRKIIKRSMGSHHSARAQTHCWITPKHILSALGEFDLDPCACIPQPWPTANKMLTVDDDGLSADWKGRVWLNPPYGNFAGAWLKRMAEHGNGIALLFARTETKPFRKYVLDRCDGLLFLYGRITFHHPDGTKARANSGAPSVLVAYGQANLEVLRRSGLPGAIVDEFRMQ